MLELYLHLVGIFLGGNEQVGNYMVTMTYQRLEFNIVEGAGGGGGEGERSIRRAFLRKAGVYDENLLFIV